MLCFRDQGIFLSIVVAHIRLQCNYQVDHFSWLFATCQLSQTNRDIEISKYLNSLLFEMCMTWNSFMQIKVCVGYRHSVWISNLFFRAEKYWYKHCAQNDLISYRHFKFLHFNSTAFLKASPTSILHMPLDMVLPLYK